VSAPQDLPPDQHPQGKRKATPIRRQSPNNHPPREPPAVNAQLANNDQTAYLDAWQSVDSDEGVPLAVAKKAFGKDPKGLQGDIFITWFLVDRGRGVVGTGWQFPSFDLVGSGVFGWWDWGVAGAWRPGRQECPPPAGGIGFRVGCAVYLRADLFANPATPGRRLAGSGGLWRGRLVLMLWPLPASCSKQFSSR